MEGCFYVNFPKMMDWIDEIETLTPPKCESNIENSAWEDFTDEKSKKERMRSRSGKRRWKRKGEGEEEKQKRQQ